MTKSIEIFTERLLLKPLGSEYFQTVNEYSTDYENTKYMCYLPHQDAEETMSFLRNVDSEWEKETPEFYEFAILYDNEHIGAVSIYFQEETSQVQTDSHMAAAATLLGVQEGTGELGWIVNKKYWGNGFAYEAAEAVVKYFIDNMGITHFIAHCDTENVASYKVMEKLGMVRTGEWGGRRNRAAVEDSFEYQYELVVAR